MSSPNESYQAAPGGVITSLSEQIFSCLRRKSAEEAQPSYDADRSDDLIKALKQRIELLTRIRAEYELEMARSLP